MRTGKPGMPKVVQSKNLDDYTVLRMIDEHNKLVASDQARGIFNNDPRPYEVLCERFPEKVVYAKFMRFSDRGWINYGTSVRGCWLEDKGKAKLAELGVLVEATRGIPA